MPNKMLIDATHPEETRVVVLRGNRVEEFDFESASRKQLRGNIYLAKVTRVEPSLQAAFVDYGGNRHGFLAFSEIHPDYYQIPVADRQALIDEEERAARAAELEADHRAGRRAERQRQASRARDTIKSAPLESHDEPAAMAAGSETMLSAADASQSEAASQEPAEAYATAAADASFDAQPEADPGADAVAEASDGVSAPDADPGEYVHAENHEHPDAEDAPAEAPVSMQADVAPSQDVDAQAERDADDGAEPRADTADEGALAAASESAPAGDNVTEVAAAGSEEEAVESVGGADVMEEVPERMTRIRRQYKIQEVIKRRQVMLVQVVKEERGTKGAALTTYLSLAGRYSVLMPNTARGGGISRKITDAVDRKRLKEVAQELEVPEGMGVILRTAGASRTKTEIKRDFEYLLRLWETVRDLTLKSTAPTLVYEEGSLVKRSIRDLYNKDIDEILVAGEEAYREAKDFMRMLMPSHGKNVKLYPDGLPIFSRFGIESQLDAMFQPVVQLRSGGYVVLNQTEALVAIDVNSGRATREHHIEDTALKTNLEAAEEIARQLRLRDLAGLIVIDFIDMDEKRNNRTVERRLKESLKHDRARIQVGSISHFGLLEMSRQRIRSSVLESSTEKCPLCGGTGHVRSVSSVALQLLRALEEILLKGATHNLVVRTRTEIALYLLNHKRAHLRELEQRFQISITVNADATVTGQVSYLIEKSDQVHSLEQAKALAAQSAAAIPVAEADEEDEAVEKPDEEEQEPGDVAEAASPDGERNGRRRRRRRRGRRGGDARSDAETVGGENDSPQRATHDEVAQDASAEHADMPGHAPATSDDEGGPRTAMHDEAGGEGERRRRRRGRRGGRRNRQGQTHDGEPSAAPTEEGADDSTPVEADGQAGGEDVEAGAIELPQHPVPELEPAEPVAEPHEAAPAALESPEAPRRGSTVREPAPTQLGSQFAVPASTRAEVLPPVVTSETESEDASRPRRSGWWSKRFGGGKD
jgi:ribonuclease E